MIRYRLDDLGWYQFEWLIQATLKDHLGVGVESWGGHSDEGRDAWFDGPLSFPAKGTQKKGPFLFQAKFIENANSAGAKPFPRLLAAVKVEMAQLKKNQKRGRRSNCKNYVLITNSLVSPTGRRRIESQIHEVLPFARAHCLGGGDVCDLLDANPAIRRAFPQLLSLRDLDVLLAGVVNRELVARSSSAISHARDIVPVFVPTLAYARTWEVLRKHRFVVLEGPPEMGKSAIAWMIALSQISSDWEALVCDAPDDFFRGIRPDVSQIFIADDAFGRTEYDPARGAKWESQLHRVLSRLGNSHWLIWTSRKHILERARKRMDLQGPAVAFPKPGEVLVDASSLTVKEKALILYRHAKYSLVDRRPRELVKANAVQIVKDNAFTPERIRRFVIEVVPELTTLSERADDPKEIATIIRKEIQNPTERMRKCFQALTLAHKWMLLCLLESETYCTTDELLRRYRNQFNDAEVKPGDVLDELSEAFVKIIGTTQRYVEWIHPSYRDLVIEQLREGGSLKSEFLSRMNLAGIKLALSQSGGVTGKLRFPLVSSAADWDLVKERCLQIASDSANTDWAALLNTLLEAVDASIGAEQSTLQRILKAACDALREKWDLDHAVLDASTIDAYAAASERLAILIPMPAMETSWQSALSSLRQQLDYDSHDFLFDTDSIVEFVALVEAIQGSEPRFLRKVGFPQTASSLMTDLLDRIDSEARSDRTYSEKEGYDSEADASFSLAELLKRANPLIRDLELPVRRSIDRLVNNANRCREEYGKINDDPDDSDDVGAQEETSGDHFNIDALFADL